MCNNDGLIPLCWLSHRFVQPLLPPSCRCITPVTESTAHRRRHTPPATRPPSPPSAGGRRRRAGGLLSDAGVGRVANSQLDVDIVVCCECFKVFVWPAVPRLLRLLQEEEEEGDKDEEVIFRREILLDGDVAVYCECLRSSYQERLFYCASFRNKRRSYWTHDELPI